MPSDKSYLAFVLDLLAPLEGIVTRPMMGEYVLYCRGKVVGGIYDDRLLLKDTPSAAALAPAAPREQPYPGAKKMLLADVDDAELTRRLVEAVANDLTK